MIIEGCQGKPRTPTIIEKICPNCGHEIELFSIDTQMPCEHCGFVAYNDTLSCVQWCQYARQCVGDEMYEKMMEIAKQQKEEAALERQKKKEKIRSTFYKWLAFFFCTCYSTISFSYISKHYSWDLLANLRWHKPG